MDIIYPRCCGLDVHKREVVACVVITEPDGTPRKAVRAFGTMTPDILALADWLAAHDVTHVAMESTGVYWKPLWNLLEDSFALLLVNARHVKAVPGRKTDVRDCEWLAELLRHGLLTGSFVPDRPQRELRELTRYRTSLVRERTAAANRLQKTLEGANIKPASVATDILGKSGREILAALVAGESDGAALAQLAQGRLREKIPQLERALVGRLSGHHRLLLTTHLAHVDFLDEAIARVSTEITERVRPDEDAITRLDTIPGVGRWPKRSSLRSAPTPHVFPTPNTWPPGPGSARATTRAVASAVVAPRVRRARGCDRAWSRPRMLRLAPRARIWRRSIGGWPPAAAGRRLPSRLLTLS